MVEWGTVRISGPGYSPACVPNPGNTVAIAVFFATFASILLGCYLYFGTPGREMSERDMLGYDPTELAQKEFQSGKRRFLAICSFPAQGVSARDVEWVVPMASSRNVREIEIRKFEISALAVDGVVKSATRFIFVADFVGEFNAEMSRLIDAARGGEK